MSAIGQETAGALGRAHAALAEELRLLEAAAEPAAGSRIEALRERLRQTQKHLADHFRFEEQDGYMDAVRAQQPRLERAVARIAEDHRTLAAALQDLIGRTGRAERLGEPLRDAVRVWVGQVIQHEMRETDLVQEAFNQDLAAED